jgi:pyridoxamine 5'-phosphate oxidase
MAEEIVTRDEIRAMRRSYSDAGLETLPENPFEAFAQWLKDAHANPVIVEANAMVLSTVTADSQINTRTVLLKDISEGGFTFFTNYQSRKAHGIELNPNVSLLFPWYAMERQVSISGIAEKVSEQESDDYFATRPMGFTNWRMGKVRSLRTLHHVKSWNSDMQVLLQSGQREQRFHVLHIGVGIE